MLKRSKNKFLMAPEVLKWRDSQHRPGVVYRLRRPTKRIQKRSNPRLPGSSRQGPSASSSRPADRNDDPWKSKAVGGDYLIGRKLLNIIGIKPSRFRVKNRFTKIICFLCEFEDKTCRFIPRSEVKKHNPKAVIRYYESTMVMINP